MNGAIVRAYSLNRDGNKKLSKNFRVREFRCSDGSDAIFISDKLVEVLQQIRDHFGRAVTITSSYRTPTHNAEVGGKFDSQHLYGLAADIKVKGVAPRVVAAYARKIMPQAGGIGIYAWGIHVDVRPYVANWVDKAA